MLLAVQGGCGLVVAQLYRMSAAVEVPSREARRAAAIAAVGTQRGLAFPAVLGYVDRLDDDAFAVMTPEARRAVRVDGLTVFRTPDRLASASELHPGAGVLVFGDPAPDGTILADVVEIHPAP